MLLCDSEIKQLVADGVLLNADVSDEAGFVGPVSYDLRTKYFVSERGAHEDECLLKPGESVFVATVETIALPGDVAARVLLKNSRIRQGLTLDAPLYFPGHKTRVFFRVTNVSGDTIELSASRGIAQIVFERLDCPATKPYVGAFSDEMDYAGMGTYKDIYEPEIRRLEEKKDELKDLERHIYGNVMAIMAVFAAIFTLVNVNMAAAGSGLGTLVTINLVTVGSFAALVALLSYVVGRSDASRKMPVTLPILVAVACFVVAIVMGIVFGW